MICYWLSLLDVLLDVVNGCVFFVGWRNIRQVDPALSGEALFQARSRVADTEREGLLWKHAAKHKWGWMLSTSSSSSSPSSSSSSTLTADDEEDDGSSSNNEKESNSSATNENMQPPKAQAKLKEHRGQHRRRLAHKFFVHLHVDSGTFESRAHLVAADILVVGNSGTCPHRSLPFFFKLTC
jgi:hypothetical protein